MIYQLGFNLPPDAAPFGPAYELLDLATMDMWPPVMHVAMCEYVGMYHVWKTKQTEIVGFTSNNQIVKGKSQAVFQPEELNRIFTGTMHGQRPIDFLVWHWIDWGPELNVRVQAEQCHAGINDLAVIVLGETLPELRGGPYCNYFASRWETFDNYMRWSWPKVEWMLDDVDLPTSMESGHSSNLAGLMERMLVYWTQKTFKTVFAV